MFISIVVGLLLGIVFVAVLSIDRASSAYLVVIVSVLVCILVGYLIHLARK